MLGAVGVRLGVGLANNLAGPDILVCTLEDSLTPAERNMVKAGEHQRLRDLRMYFQHASEAEFVEAVERITGRRVRAFVSGMDIEQDVAAEIFCFESSSAPAGDGSGTAKELPR